MQSGIIYRGPSEIDGQPIVVIAIAKSRALLTNPISQFNSLFSGSWIQTEKGLLLLLFNDGKSLLLLGAIPMATHFSE